MLYVYRYVYLETASVLTLRASKSRGLAARHRSEINCIISTEAIASMANRINRIRIASYLIRKTRQDKLQMDAARSFRKIPCTDNGKRIQTCVGSLDCSYESHVMLEFVAQIRNCSQYVLRRIVTADRSVKSQDQLYLKSQLY